MAALVPHVTDAQESTDVLLTQAATALDVSPEAAKVKLEQLAKLEPAMSPLQRGTYFKLMAMSYAFRGMYKEQVEVSRDALKSVTDPNQRAMLLYHLADGYSNLGEYENAILTMNDAIQLLPNLTNLEAKAGVLQSAYSVLQALRAYDEAASYAERLASMPSNGNAMTACVGLADLVELGFMQRDGVRARRYFVDASKACERGGFNVIVLSLRALDQADRLGSTSDPKVLANSIALLEQLTRLDGRSDYCIHLADAIAKRYLANGQPSNAEPYATRAVQWANTSSAILLKQQTNDTMTAVMRAQGKLEQALKYFEAGQALWTKLLEERSRKDLAYQRVKFQTQDQTNQLKLLGQINKLLTSERELQERNKQSLELLVVVTGLLLAFVVVWLMRTWRQKNDYRTFSQIDGLTKVSNRTHLMTCANEAFKDARGSIAVVLFDMDEFKQINDTFNHATGDWVLKTVSDTIARCLRAQDMFGRLGGEEFAICLPNTPEHEAMVLAERCRSAISAIDSTPSGFNFPISASFGIAVRPPNGAANFEETLAAADQALYRAKHLGRNRIETHGEMFTNMEQAN